MLLKLHGFKTFFGKMKLIITTKYLSRMPMELTLTMAILAAVFVGEENAQIAKFACWLTEKDRNNLRNIFLKIPKSLFDNANRRLYAPTELC